MANNKVSTEIIELQSLLTSRAFYNVLEEHKKSLQDEVNKFVLAQDLTNAYGALRALKDADRILRLTQQKLDELKK